MQKLKEPWRIGFNLDLYQSLALMVAQMKKIQQKKNTYTKQRSALLYVLL